MYLNIYHYFKRYKILNIILYLLNIYILNISQKRNDLQNKSSLSINVQNLYFCPQNIVISEKKMLIAFNQIYDPYFSPKLRCRQRARGQLPEAGRQGGYHHGATMKK